MPNDVALGQELLNVPMGDMIRDMAFAIADAQMELDSNSVEVAEMMSGLKVIYNNKGEKEFDDSRVYFGHTYNDANERVPSRVSMLELGFTPTFYQFVDTIIEVKIAIKITQTDSSFERQRETSNEINKSISVNLRRARGTRSRTVNTSQVDASYASRYSYSAEGASLLRTKLCPVPPPPILEERIRAIMELEASRANP